MTTAARAATIRGAAVFLAVVLASCGGGGDGSTAGTSTGSPSAPAGSSPSTPADSTSAPRTGSASLAWSAPTHNDDGTPIGDLAGFRVYSGTSASSMALAMTIVDPRATSAVLANLPAGATHYFAVSAYNSTGSESDRSSIGSKLIP